MYNTQEKTAAIAFQTMINIHADGSPLALDGELGAATRAKAAKLAGKDSVIDSIDNAVIAIVSYPTVISFKFIKNKFDALQSSGLIDRKLSWAMFDLALHLENAHDGTFIYVDYEGTYRGLFQFSEKTWNSVMEHGSWKGGRASASLQLQAMGKLLTANRQYHLMKNGIGAYSPEIAYLYHNQGASSAYSFLKTGHLRYPKQSLAALDIFDIARGKVSPIDRDYLNFGKSEQPISVAQKDFVEPEHEEEKSVIDFLQGRRKS